MDPSFQPFDWQRMFIGDAQLLFLAEIVVRTLLLYLFALIMLRVMGKRGMAQLTPFEFVIIVALGSAVGDPMFYADVPLIHGFVVIASVVLAQRALAVLTSRRSRIDELVSGRPTVVVHRGRIQSEVIEKEKFSIPEILEMLRLQGVARLEDVELAIMEDAGRLSILRSQDADKGTSSEIWSPEELSGPT